MEHIKKTFTITLIKLDYDCSQEVGLEIDDQATVIPSKADNGVPNGTT